ncbi:hypothetical protein IHQ71_29680 (plasmid) [Rhizobium sp. TH2]|uniref:hypothetical protein n=1 Tax=Rhizobium sp. TH2 TaxID=2775403 RepID=UPI0021577015|nr:hypothetical protein [Rhizobium sp. TH2]UVC12205.1 hypothetical protein IHQ71_29680 [Rhizobium sp. TH2]
MASDLVQVQREAIMSCRKAGTISIPGVYVGFGDKIPLGVAMNKGLTLKMGQTHVQKYTKPSLEKIVAAERVRRGEVIDGHEFEVEDELGTRLFNVPFRSVLRLE